jgi:hypothetical protein
MESIRAMFRLINGVSEHLQGEGLIPVVHACNRSISSQLCPVKYPEMSQLTINIVDAVVVRNDGSNS